MQYELSPQSKQDNSPMEFMRVLLMRLLFGIAYMLGFGESASNAFGGALVPPGSDYDDDYDIF